MTHALNPSLRLDVEPAEAEDSAMLNIFQVLAINLCCFLALTGAAIFFGVTWWVAILIGWVGASVATLPVAALVILLWPVASHEAAHPAPGDDMTASATQAHLAMWARDLEEECDAALRAEAHRDRTIPEPGAKDTTCRTAGFFTMAQTLSTERRAA
jgi:hypothetical protein